MTKIPIDATDTTHDATVEGLRRWAFYDDFVSVIDAYRPRLTAAEQARIDEE